MFKKILSVVLTVVMLASLVTVVSADDPATIKDALDAYGDAHGKGDISAWLTRMVEVPTDIEIKNPNTGSYTDGPVKVSKSNISQAPAFDFKAVIDMEAVKNAFDGYVGAAEMAINEVGGANIATLMTELDNIQVTGSFTIKVNVPEDMVIPEETINKTDLTDFNAEAQANFYQIGERDYTDNVLTVTIGVGSADTPYRTKTELAEFLGTDLVLTCSGVTVTAFKTYQITGEMSGTTVIGGDIATVNYVSVPLGTVGGNNHNPDASAKPLVSATITVSKSGGGGGGGGGTTTDDEVEVDFYVNGKLLRTVKGRGTATVDVDKIVPDEIPDGFEFAGWYSDKELTKKVTGEIEVNKDTNLYAKFVIKGGNILNKDDHFAYIIGYTDGTVRPLNNILREEVATIFFRLMTEEAGEAAHATVAPFSDVPETRWSSTAIATMAKGGFITGRDDGTFGPELYITRAEFATIAARFSGDTTGEAISFSDTDKHWAKNYIDVCTANGWITGYTDGTFKPDQYITRTEAMAIVNRMLDRSVDEAGIEAVKNDICYFPDNPKESWSYYIVLEATNSHDFVRAEGEANETWTKVTDIRDWTVYEN